MQDHRGRDPCIAIVPMTPFLDTLMAIGALCVACWVVFILIALLSVFARMWGGTTVQERAETGIGGVGDGAQDPEGGVMAHIDGDVVEPSDDPRWPTGSCHLSRVSARPPPSSRFVTQRSTIWPH